MENSDDYDTNSEVDSDVFLYASRHTECLLHSEASKNDSSDFPQLSALTLADDVVDEGVVLGFRAYERRCGIDMWCILTGREARPSIWNLTCPR